MTFSGEARPWGKLIVRREQEGPRDGGKEPLGGRHLASLGLKGKAESTAFWLSFQRALQVLLFSLYIRKIPVMYFHRLHPTLQR